MKTDLENIPSEWGLGRPEIEKIYQVEVEQADKLRRASAPERKKLYSSIYEEYFQKLPFHPQFTIKQNEELKQHRIKYQLAQISPFINGRQSFMEIGAGDCSLSIAVAPQCKAVYSLEVSASIAKNAQFPSNLNLILFDGFNIPLQENSVDVAYSNQLMEHLHPDDAEEQLRSIFRVLKPNGVYICITPNRISGPHDISRFFNDKPVGFHLREYSAGDLGKIFHHARFTRVIAYTVIKGRKLEIPFFIVRFIEFLAESLPVKQRTRFLNFRPVNIIFNTIIAGIK